MKVTLLICTLNEIDGMKHIMPRINREWVDQIIIVDGGSTDGTIEYARENGFFVLKQKGKGIRTAYAEALEHIIGDAIILFSPDGNCVPELIPPLVEKIKEGYDMVIVSRYSQGAKSYDDDILTGFGNWMFTFLINLFFGGKCTDTMVIFRAFKKELVPTLDLDKESSYSPRVIFGRNLSWEILLSMRCAKRKLKVAEIPGDEPARIGGQRKMLAFRWGAVLLAGVFREIFVWR